MRLFSACLLGEACRYDGCSRTDGRAARMAAKGAFTTICPEELGGLPTPRPPAEIQGGDGANVLNGKARVVNTGGMDVTENFIKGAFEVLKIAELGKFEEAILKQRSPSCGSGLIYDGGFSGKLIKGDGVAAALLKQNGIRVFSEENL